MVSVVRIVVWQRLGSRRTFGANLGVRIVPLWSFHSRGSFHLAVFTMIGMCRWNTLSNSMLQAQDFPRPVDQVGAASVGSEERGRDPYSVASTMLAVVASPPVHGAGEGRSGAVR